MQTDYSRNITPC